MFNSFKTPIFSTLANSKIDKSYIASDLEKKQIDDFKNSGLTAYNYTNFNKKTLDNVKSYISTLREGQGDIQKFETHMLRMGKGFTNVASTAKNFGLSILKLSGAMLAVQGISFLINKFDELTHAQENAKAAAEGVLSNYKNLSQSAQNNQDTVKNLKDRYESLSQGVGKLGENLSLTTEEYAEYNTIANRIADLFPNLVSGHTAEGNAILSVKGNIDELTQSYKENAKAARDYIILNASTVLESYDKNMNGTFLQEGLQYKQAQYQLLQNVLSSEEELDSFVAILTHNPTNKYSHMRSVVQKLYNDAGYGGFINFSNRKDIVQALLDSKTTIYSTAASINRDIQTNLDNTISIAEAYLGNNDDYQEMEPEIKSLASYIVHQMDTEVANSLNGDSTAISNWVQSITSTLNDTNIKNPLQELIQLTDAELPVSEYVAQAKTLMAQLSNSLGDNHLLKTIETLFDFSKSESLLNEVLERYTPGSIEPGKFYDKEIENFIKNLNQESLSILCDIEFSGPLTKQSLEVALNRVKPLSKKFADLWSSEGFASAKEGLLTLAKESKVTDKDIESIAQSNSELAELLDQTGISARFAAECVNQIGQGKDGFANITEQALLINATLMESERHFDAARKASQRYHEALGEDDYNTGFKDQSSAWSSAMDAAGRKNEEGNYENGTGEYGKQFRAQLEYLFGDQSYAWSIEQATEKLREFEDVWGAEDNGKGIMNRLMELQERNGMEGFNTFISENNGIFAANIDMNELDLLSEKLGISKEALLNALQAYNMFGETISFNTPLLEESLKAIGLAATDGGEKTTLSMQGMETMLKNLGYTGYEAYQIMEDIKGMEGINLLDFSVTGKEEIQSTLEQLDELANFDLNITGEYATVDLSALTEVMLGQLGMSQDSVNEFIRNMLSEGVTLLNGEGIELDLSGALNLVSEQVNQLDLGNLQQINQAASDAALSVDSIVTSIDGVNQVPTDGAQANIAAIGTSVDNVNSKVLNLIASILFANTLSFGSNTPTPKGSNTSPTSPTSTTTTRRRLGGTFTEADGTAHAFGTALSSGDWSLSHDETALTGELGQELVVRNGHYFTVGDTGPEMARLRRGDIVFNHRQTKDLLSKGYATGRGRAFANGSAYAAGTSGSNSTEEEFKELTDWIGVLIDVFQRKVKDLDRLANNVYQKYTDQNPVLDQMASDIHRFLSSEEQLYNRYMQQAGSVGLNRDYIQKIQNGTLDIETITDQDLKEKITDYTKWYKQALDIRDTMNDLKKQLRDIAAQKLDNIVNDFKQLLDVNQSLVSYQEKYISLLEESGKPVGEGDYAILLGQEANNIRYLNAELKTLTAEYNKLLAAGELDFDNWKEWQATLTDIETKILESEIALEKYKKEIRTARWSGFTKFVDSLEDGNSALGDMLTLLGDSGLLDESGISTRGKTYLGLISEQLVNNKKLAAQYKAAIATLGQELKKGTITQQEYDKELLKYQELQRQAAIDTKKAKDAIVDFIKEAIDKETEAFEKLINVKKDALRVQKQNDDYARKVSDKQKQINAVKSRLAGLEGNDSAAAIQERKKLNSELKGLEEALEDIQKDRQLEVLENTYEEALKLFEEHQDEVKERLDSDLELQNQEIANMLVTTKDSYNEIYDYLQKLSDNYNATLTDRITAPWESGTKAAQNYYEAVNKLSASTGVDTSAVSSASKNESDIRGLYQSILGREADSSGLNYWLNKMDSGMTLSEIESGILGSSEYQVKDLYRTLLGRTASGSEVQYWIDKLNSGMSLSQVADAFKASPEYKTHANAFVNDLYKTVLGRTAGSSEVNSWVQRILSGMSKKEVAKAFYGSAEYQNKYAGKSNQEYVTALYKSMLNRSPDSSGLDTYVNMLNAGKSRSEIANIILMSREFTDLRGYAKGAKRIAHDQLAYVGEQGVEAIMTDKGLVTSLPGGTTVFTNGQTMELWGASKDPSAWIADNLAKALPAYSALAADTAAPLTVHIESMIGNVEHVDKNSLPAYEKLLKDSADYTIDLIRENYRKLN